MPSRSPELPRLSRQGLMVLKLFLDEQQATHSGAEIMRATGLPSGTLYPILLRFERQAIFKSKWEEGKAKNLGRPRQRFYSITGHGLRVAREALDGFRAPGVLRPAFG